jgi:hypothetical protein
MSLNMRIEEVETVSEIELDAFHDQKIAFVDFSDDYDDPFETDARAKLALIKNVVTTKFHIAEIANLTANIKQEICLLFPLMDPLQKYAKKVGDGLTVLLKNFGVKKVRSAAHSNDADKVEEALKTLMKNVDDNKTKLQLKGYKDADYNRLKDLRTKIFDDKTHQKSLMYDKEQAVAANMTLFVEMIDIVKDIQETGKILFKRTNPALAKEFTMINILHKIRHYTEPDNGPDDTICGAVDVHCTDGATGKGVPDVWVTIFEYNQKMKTDIAGRTLFDKVPTEPEKMVTIKFVHPLYKEVTLTDQKLIPEEILNVDVVLEKIPVPV